MTTNRRRRSDYAQRLAARRNAALDAYCQAMGGPKRADARMKFVAGHAGVQERTFRGYLSGRYDMGRRSCLALDNQLAAAGKSLADFSDDEWVQRHGVWVFANPKRKVPFMPQSMREARAKAVIEVLTGIVKDIKGDTSSEVTILTAIAKLTDLKYNSVLMVARSCSYFSADRIAKLHEALAKAKSSRDISILGQDPRDWDDDSDDEVEEGETNGEAPATMQQFALSIAKLGPKDILIATGNGDCEIFPDGAVAVIVIRPGSISVKSAPAGAELGQATVLTGNDGSGVISVPFSAAAPAPTS